jgi:phospholipid transport system substrate-binding protein
MERVVPLVVSRRLIPTVAAAAAASAALLTVSVPVWAADPAADLISTTATEVIDAMKQTPAGPQRAAVMERVLQTKFDLPSMAQFALGQFWNKATPQQQQRFVQAAQAAEARAYSDRFGNYAGQSLQVGRVISRGGKYYVESTINQSSGQPIKLEWEVKSTPNGLRVTDIKVEGVSMIQTRRADFTSYIQNHGGDVDALTNELQTRATAAAAAK